MSGKAYTMKEMKNIVDYLTEHRAYSEIKGRKMWMDLESSKVTNRTWQSLKETFLKRILPDIHNPYYKLSIQQISSFQQGYDIETRLNNKLEICATDPESNKNGDNKHTHIPDVSNGKEEDKAAGEDPIQSNLRASTETLLLENCYETAEDIRKDLQSPGEAGEEDNNREKSPTKSMRELITYSEPLTPMLQSVIDDFASDEDCDEPKMQIVEQEEPADKNTGNSEDNVTIEISDSEGNETHEPAPEKSKSPDHNQPSSPNKINGTNKSSSKVSESKESEKSENQVSQDEMKDKNIDDISLKTSKDDKLQTSTETNKNVSNNTTDTLLPGNQEALDKKFTTISNNLKLSLNKKNKIQNGRKRASSQDIEVKSKKRVLDKKKSTSDTEPSISISGNINKILEVSSVKETIAEESTQISPNIVPPENNLSKEIIATEDLQQDVSMTNSAENENLCLNSVSLYAEQFSNTKYSDSETSLVEDNNNRDKNENKRTDENVKTLDDKTQKDDVIKNRHQIHEKKEIINEKKHKKSEKKEKIVKNNEKIGKKEAADASTRVRNEDSDMIVLNSHSDSVSDSGDNIPSKKDQKRLAKQQKERALANVFGFSSGGATRSHRRGLECRRRTVSHKRKRQISSASSDWTSDSGSDYVSPPRHYTRKRRMTRKYLKPKPARIMSLEEEGGLFVMHGKKIYPLVKDGKIVKNYLTYNPEDDDDPEESFWKLKYVEEKKKTAELTKLLNKAEEKEKRKVELNEEPVLRTTTHTCRASVVQQDSCQRETKIPAPAETKPAAEVPEIKPDTEMKTVKIKFIKKNEEVQIEGHWSHLNPVLAHVAQLFNKEPEEKKVQTLAIRKSKPKIVQRSSAPANTAPVTEVIETVELSGPSTPLEECIERVNKREDEIAKEIEEHFKAESRHEMDSSADNITKRKGRPRSSPVIKTPDPVKKMRLGTTDQEPKVLQTVTTEQEMDANENKVETNDDKTTEHKVQLAETAEKQTQITGVELIEKVTETEKDKTVTKRRTRTRKTVSTGETNDTYTLRTRRSTSRKSSEQGVDNPKMTNSKVTQEEDNVRYKFPPTPPTTRKSYTNKQNKVPKKTNQRNTKSALNLEVNSPCENVSSTSEENKDENQDSDFSRSSSLHIKRITNASIPSNKKEIETSARQAIHPDWTDDITSESNNSFTTVPLKSMTFQNSSLSSEIYTSESYRLLMNKECLPNRKTSKLNRIEEANTSSDVELNVDIRSETASPINCNIDSKRQENKEALYIGTDNENSSNISLPTSPVLSIVENITISKVLLSSVEADDFSLDYKIGSNDENDQIMLNELMKPDHDLSMPLMERDCGIETSCQDGKKYHYNLNMTTTRAPVSDSLVKKINTINIDDPTLSESLTVKLRDLLLKSSKKSNDIIGDEKKDESGIKKIKSRKRSSTPRKRSRIQNLIFTNAKTSIEEEHMDSCSQISRKTCPPLILITDYESNEKEQNYPNETMENLNEKPKRTRNKKDIIKVKINKPKSKMQDISRSKQNSHGLKFTDSGIHDTVTDLILKNLNDSVDLIHNHSETCLSAHECMGDSVQIIEKSAFSMVSLNSNSAHSDIFGHKNVINTSTSLTQEFFSSDAQDGANLIKEPGQVDNNTPTVFHTPQETLNSPNSLITEDLSDEIPDIPHHNTKWYLFSEEETNTNFLDSNNKNSDEIGHGSRLEQIFPITCAIPDLSTITEISRENGDSKKCDDANLINNFDSPSIFDN